MSDEKKILKNINLAKKSAATGGGDELMGNPDYLRQSNALITEALQKGFDVLQLPDGDIVTTGTKTIVFQYHWDEKKGELIKVTPTDMETKKEMIDIDAE